MSALRFRNVVKRYGSARALDGLNLEIPKGSIFGLVGSNGAGKTTMMSVAAGLVRVQAGDVDVLGRGPFHPRQHAGRVSLLPQDSGLPYYARVAHLLYYYGRLQGLNRTEARRAVHEVLGWVNLADRAQSRVRALSHGMMRRVTVAQAFLGEPELVLLDEPMSGLDPVEVQNIRRLIKERRGRQTIVVSSHMLFELQHLCDHVAIIEHGKLVRQEKMSDLTRHSHRVVYRLGAEPPLETLQQRVPLVEFTWNVDQQSLEATYPDEDMQVETVNAQVLPMLLEAGCPVTEVIRGSDLESEYLKTRSASA